MKVEVTDNRLIKLIAENEAEERLFDEMYGYGIRVYWRVGSELGFCSENQWGSGIPSSEKDISVSPMLFQKSTRIPGGLMIDLASDRYHMPEFLKDSALCWVHEFSEQTIFDLLPPYLRRKGAKVFLTVKQTSIPHLMVSLHTLSIVEVENEKIVIQPSDFEKYVPWRRARRG